MILVDTSIWVAHLKHPDGQVDLIAALEQGVAAVHPFVEGELLLAGAPIDTLLGGVSMLPLAPHRDVRAFVDGLDKPIRRIGWVDAHLVHAALVNHCLLLTRDASQTALFRRCRA